MLGASCAALEIWLYNDSQALALADRELKILWLNASAERLLQRSQVLTTRHGSLAAHEREEHQRLVAFFRALPVDKAVHVVAARSPSRNVVLRACKVQDDELELLGLRIKEARPLEDSDLAGVCSALRLTPAQCRVVQLLATGRSPEGIAEQLEVSVETVRTHLKSAYARLGVSTRGELFSTLHSYALAE